MSPSDIQPVLIVGAGPTGMTAALDLAHYGIPSILLDDDHKLSDGSRAIAFHHTALAVWDKLGAGEAILKKGIPWTVRHTFYKEKELYSQVFPKPPEGMLPRFLNIQQYYVEQYLLERIRENPLIDIFWDHKVTGLKQETQHIWLEVETPGKAKRLEGSYVLACDGARSTLRRLLDLDFPGKTHNDRFLIADIRADLDSPPEPRFYFNHPAHPGPTVLIHPQPDGVWRIDWQIGAEADVDLERSPERMDARIRAFIGEVPYEVVWLSDYRFHQRLLREFRHGRVFFAGDAAHLVAPFGARGLNSAVQDVENLAWKLAFVLKGWAPETLLDTYQAERWPAQAENQRVTDRTMRFMSPPNMWWKFVRSAILHASGPYAPARKWVDSGRMSVPFVYKSSPLTIPDDEPPQTWKDAPELGAQLPDAPIEIFTGGQIRKTFLRKILGSGFVVLYFVENTQQADEALAATGREKSQFPLAVYPVSPEETGKETLVLDPDGSLAHLFAARRGTALIVRPDRHLAARRHQASMNTILKLLSQQYNLANRFQ